MHAYAIAAGDLSFLLITKTEITRAIDSTWGSCRMGGPVGLGVEPSHGLAWALLKSRCRSSTWREMAAIRATGATRPFLDAWRYAECGPDVSDALTAPKRKIKGTFQTRMSVGGMRRGHQASDRPGEAVDRSTSPPDHDGTRGARCGCPRAR